MMAVALVITTPMPANTVIVVGSATICPKACWRWERPKRVKSGMFKESVAQYPTIAVSAGKNAFQKPLPRSLPGWARIGPRPCAWEIAHQRSAAVITSTKGAAQFATRRKRSMPRYTMAMFSAQPILARALANQLSLPVTGPPIRSTK